MLHFKYEINTIKSVESKKVGNFFKLIRSKPYPLSGEPRYEILSLNGTNVDTTHNAKNIHSLVHNRWQNIPN